MANVERAARLLLRGPNENQAHDREDAAVEPEEAAPARPAHGTSGNRRTAAGAPAMAPRVRGGGHLGAAKDVGAARELTKGTPARYAATRVKVEEGAMLEKLGEKMASMAE